MALTLRRGCIVCAPLQDGDDTRRWVWVPYRCYLHLFDPEEAALATHAAGIHKVLVMGDSQQREMYISLSRVLGASFYEPMFSRHASTIPVPLGAANATIRTVFQSYELDTMLRPYKVVRTIAEDAVYLRYHGVAPMGEEVCQ